jgi:peptidoglycan hydrolase-like protein with peptidoglycan-binding domain
MRLLVAAFLAIATAISVNALYFQTPPVSAAREAATVAQKLKTPDLIAQAADGSKALTTSALPEKRPARQEKDAQNISQAAGSARPSMIIKAEPQPITLVRAIQKKLQHFGYRNLPQDGIAGLETRAAILATEFEQGLPLSGEPADTVLSALYFLEASGRTRLPASDRFERDARLVKDVQDLLAKLGYTSGPISGKFDAWTRDAVRKFENDRRLNADGRLTERILLEMVIEKGEPLLSKG